MSTGASMKQEPIEAAVFRRLLSHLDSRKDVQNIDLMNLAGFCRNCLSKWYAEAAAEHGIAVESVLVEPRLALQCAVINTPTLVLLQRENQGWQLQARRSITSSRQLQTLMDAYLVQAEKVSADYRLGVRA